MRNDAVGKIQLLKCLHQRLSLSRGNAIYSRYAPDGPSVDGVDGDFGTLSPKPCGSEQGRGLRHSELPPFVAVHARSGLILVLGHVGQIVAKACARWTI